MSEAGPSTPGHAPRCRHLPGFTQGPFFAVTSDTRSDLTLRKWGVASGFMPDVNNVAHEVRRHRSLQNASGASCVTVRCIRTSCDTIHRGVRPAKVERTLYARLTPPGTFWNSL